MLYFAYGSNLNVASVADWCRHYGLRAPNIKNGRPAILDNYRLAFPIFSEYWGGGTADIAYDPGKHVAGVVFDLTEAEMGVLDQKVRRKLDSSAKELGIYKRITIEVRPMGKGPTMPAVTYQGVEPEGFHIPPTQTYMDLLIQGAYEHGLSMMWVAYLNSFSTQAARPPKPPAPPRTGT